MKCKVTRKDEKIREKVYRTFFEELQKLNPKKMFSMDGNVIQVNMTDLWRLNLPESCEVIAGKDKKEFEDWGHLTIRIQKFYFYIWSW